MTKPFTEEEKTLLLAACLTRLEPQLPRHDVLLAELPRHTAEERERAAWAYAASLEEKLKNSIEISPGNAKLIIQFLPKPVVSDDWEVDATIDLLWKELERQAAKA